MVAIKNLSIASAVLLIAEQGLAAPINTRAPRRGVKSGIANNLISTGGQVATAALGARDVDELDERDIMEEIYARYLDEAEDFEY
jgi:hypothetical protein